MENDNIINLNTCKKGDILISKHGTKLTYVQKLPECDYYQHKVKYSDPKLGYGTRTDDGHVFKHNRMETDEDIVQIIHI